MKRVGVDPSPLSVTADERRRNGAGVMFVAVDGKLAGLLAVADPVRANAHQALADLHREGVRVIILTGANPITADAVAQQAGVDEVHAQMRPGDKADFVAPPTSPGTPIGDTTFRARVRQAESNN